VTLNWSHDGVNLTSFTIQRATNATFTRGVTSVTPPGTGTTLTDSNNLRANTSYYYRVRANGTGGSSDWTNASPFPVRPLP
jgi:phosphodiesterase/alkaline phosphatase D-like protein